MKSYVKIAILFLPHFWTNGGVMASTLQYSAEGSRFKSCQVRNFFFYALSSLFTNIVKFVIKN